MTIVSKLISDTQAKLASAATATKAAEYDPGSRWIVNESGYRQPYTGPGLVGNEKLVTKDYYDLIADTNSIYARLTGAQRVTTMKRLVDAGFLSPNGVGNVNSELNAMQSLLEYSNIVGRVWNEALELRLSDGPIKGGGGPARTIRTTSPQDLAKVAQNVAQNTMGRGLTEEELNRFVKSYQDQEIAMQRPGGGVIADAPSIDVAAERFVQENQPKEESAYRYLGYMNKLFESIGAI
jgi:hypothetical protein